MPPKQPSKPTRNEGSQKKNSEMQRQQRQAAQHQQGAEARARETAHSGSDSDGSEEEEPEGEDLFGDNFYRDYNMDEDSLDDDDEIEEEGATNRSKGTGDDSDDDGFIVDDDEMEEAEEDLSYEGRLAVERKIEERNRREAEEMREQNGDDEFLAMMQSGHDEGRQKTRKRKRRDDLGSSESDSDDIGPPRPSSMGMNDITPDDEQYGDNRDPNVQSHQNRYSAREAAVAAQVQALFGVGLTTTAANSAYVIEDEIYLNDRLADQASFDWTKPQGTLTDWLSQELPRRVAKNRIFHFLCSFVRQDEFPENNLPNTNNNTQRFTYRESIKTMVQNNEQSFEVSYWDLGAVYDSTLAVWLADVPELLVELLEEAANYLLYRILYPHYSRIHRKVFVRLAGLPVCDPIRDFRQIHMNVIVRVEGVVIRRSPIYPQLQAVKYDCLRCSFIIGPIVQRGEKETKVSQCPSCHSKGPFRVNMALTEYRNHQTIVLQEPPGKVPPGRLPRSLEVVLTNDLIDRVKPGEEVEVTGVYKNSFDPVLNTKQGFPVFSTVLVANNICRRIGGGVEKGGASARNRLGTDGVFSRMPDAEREVIIRLANHPNIKKKLVQSIAPSIHGRDDIKLGLLLSLLGGVAKDVGGDQSHRIRGDINILLVGDPGCAKSQFLKFVEMTADRAVFTTGRGSTAVGLTASVHRDPITGDFTLEGGALVIADRGVCLIDEFDKMSDQDRTSIHEAMEQQTISIAKGGIVTTLSARCAIIAAANPIGGRYDPSVPFDSNVNLTTPILSRFDLLFVVRDEISPENDLKLATFITGSHFKNHPTTRQEMRDLKDAHERRMTELRQQHQSTDDAEEQRAIAEQIGQLRQQILDQNNSDSVVEDLNCDSPNPLPQRILRQYLSYAKHQCTPRVVNIDDNTITRVYTELRQESKLGGIPITVRHMESLIRLTEAHARLHLRDSAVDEDLTAAISIFLRCFLQTQKYSARTALNEKFQKYLHSDKEPLQLLHYRLKMLIGQSRQLERQISGGIEPVTVSVECGEMEAVCSTIGVGRGVLQNYYQCPAFKREFELVLNDSGIPSSITHTKLVGAN